jgi:glycosyltransferase involved in cell wall biosynthesis
VDTVFVHTLAQETVALARCGFTARQIELIPYQVDPDFWNMEAYIEQLARETRNRPIHEKPYICSAGMECRDYGTLLKAIEGLDIELRLAVGSHYSQSKGTGLSEELPPNVKVKFYNYTELRELYANSAFVVMPTYDVDHSAGVTSIMEAMGLGKAVIATRSVGQSDVLNDRRTTTRKNFNRIANATFSKIYAPSHLSNLQTGLYVNPGQADEMRQAIEHLLANPAKATEIGENARRLIEASLTLNHFCERIKDKMADQLSLPLKSVPVPG